MNPTELSWRVTFETGVVIAALALLAAWVGGSAAAAGVGAGGALALANFRWLSGQVPALLAGGGGRGPFGGWALGLGLRLMTAAVATAALLGSGWAHPVGIVVGLTVLPCTLIMRGLAQAGERS